MQQRNAPLLRQRKWQASVSGCASPRLRTEGFDLLLPLFPMQGKARHGSKRPQYALAYRQATFEGRSVA